MKQKLKQYLSRRNFHKTPEPKGETVLKSDPDKPLFVVQKHAGRSLHYDFRIEIDGVLKSWTVPKGPSLNPKEKRLAILTENHPLQYAQFEGIIPEGEYGAGNVIVWDIGYYRNVKDTKEGPVSMSSCFSQGKIEIELHGQKLNGVFALVRTKMRGSNKHYLQWLLIKKQDNYAQQRDVTCQDRSVLSGKTLEDIK
ncbi:MULTISPECIES: DNA polymerase ligase N-terminal domain-containing protein [Francisella]|uniref:DNA ligase n=1 Tax=Francisella opportunistica TaxID=2016517 RepID=A0A345JRH6_9GAMM|nr:MULTISPECIES: DNA polymerase ligase N-terminal domain-containing protein [Francisella]APC91652.1 ATP-dependent DNA ligase clustered with Ku protein, LigD [Francisella sp. MA067296]AXH29922.1 DNA ligase [Francisella opportunistica]AXH31569.1 DNA ligase [Francisella opportunistica]AXH33217.1 DNA ligase [Francisella opportunistica]